jgi:16S rRNA (cytidine1402-2'-O)-methyltransferase
MLYIVSTPIGNLKDITLRALEVLKSVDFIACEDTRQTLKLLRHYNIKKPLVSYYSYNKIQRGDYILGQLKTGKSCALVSDSGTPGISDPGWLLVKTAIETGLNISAIPGPSASLAALSVSGFPADRFLFCGFLSPKPGRRKNQLKELGQEEATLIFYESPHRLLKTLADMLEVFGDRPICICRELTKRFEEIRREKLSFSLEHFRRALVRGEFVIILRLK